ncbi:MAG: outer membrane beta-barrel protein [Gemmatimonas sp.]
MSNIRIVAAAAIVLAAPLRAQSAGAPPLHVDPTVEECEVRFASTLTQKNFHRFAREFGSVSAFKQAGMPSTLGRGNVSIGIEAMSFTLEDESAAWNDTFTHPNDHHPLGSRQNFPKVKLQVGVADNVDVGAFYTRNPKSNYGWFGIDGKYRMMAESDDRPVSVAMRGAYTKTLYVSDMDMHALTADVSIERRIGWGLRPYVGVGADGVYVRETSDAVNLRNETTIAPHVFAGVGATVLRRVNLGAEFTIGALPSAQVQVAAVVF